MNILITGKSGFLAREFKEYFSKRYQVSCLGRDSLDLTDSHVVDTFFSMNEYVDVIIHTAVKGGKKNDCDTFDTLSKNICMFSNLTKHRNKYGMLFCFGSGAEYDRRTEIKNVREGEFVNFHPNDYYGFAKNNIAREIFSTKDNIFNFRLFGCFGKYEDNARFIKGSIKKIINEEPIAIHKNKYMDFFYVDDLCTVIDFYIKNSTKSLPREVNMVYNKKWTLQDIAHKIKEVSKSSVPINIENTGDLSYYTGDATTLYSLGIPLKGLVCGVEEMWECLS